MTLQTIETIQLLAFAFGFPLILLVATLAESAIIKRRISKLAKLHLNRTLNSALGR